MSWLRKIFGCAIFFAALQAEEAPPAPEPEPTPSQSWHATERLPIGSAGTLELAFAPGPASYRVPGRQTLLSMTGEAGTRFTLWIDWAAGQIGLSSPGGISALEVGSTLARPFHLAVVAHGDHAEVYDLNFGQALGPLLAGLGEGRVVSVDLGQANAHAAAFSGTWGMFRIWDQPLSPREMMSLAPDGTPAEPETLSARLLASAVPAAGGLALNFSVPETYHRPPAGMAVGTSDWMAMDPDWVFRGLEIRSRAVGLASVENLFQAPSRLTTALRADAQELHTERQWRARLLRADLSLVWQDILRQAKELDRQAPPAGPAWQAQLAGITAASAAQELEARLKDLLTRSLAFTGEAAEGLAPLRISLLRGMAFASQLDPVETKEKVLSKLPATPLALEPGEQVLAIAGQAGDQVDSLRVLTDRRVGPLFGGAPVQTPDFTQRLSAGLACAGVRTWVETGVVRGIALVYRAARPGELAGADPSQPLAAPARVDRGRWAPRARNERPVLNNDPVRASGYLLSNGQVRNHGNYGYLDPATGEIEEQYLVVRVWEIPSRDELWIGYERGCDSRDGDHGVALFRRAAGTRFQPVSAPPGPLQGVERIHWDGTGGFKLGAVEMERATLHPLAGDPSGPNDQKLPWDSTFGGPERPPNLSASIYGYDWTRLDPRRLQSQTGASHPLFLLPRGDSQDFYFSAERPGMTIPYGFLLVNDVEGDEATATEVTTNSTEYDQRWSVNAGVSAGAPGVGSVGVEGSYQQDLQQMRSSEQMYAITTSTQYSHALVLDKLRASVSADFAAGVQRLVDATLARGTGSPPMPPTDAVDAFLDTFGNHYPFAVTYGSMFCREREFTKQEYATLRGYGMSLSVNASANVEGVDLGGKAGMSQETSTRNAGGVSREKDRSYTYGGEISDGGWRPLPGQEAPLMLDLRPLQELLSPLFFDDPLVWNQARAAVGQAVARRVSTTRPPDTGSLPTVVNVRIRVYNLDEKSAGFQNNVLNLNGRAQGQNPARLLEHNRAALVNRVQGAVWQQLAASEDGEIVDFESSADGRRDAEDELFDNPVAKILDSISPFPMVEQMRDLLDSVRPEIHDGVATIAGEHPSGRVAMTFGLPGLPVWRQMKRLAATKVGLLGSGRRVLSFPGGNPDGSVHLEAWVGVHQLVTLEDGLHASHTLPLADLRTLASQAAVDGGAAARPVERNGGMLCVTGVGQVRVIEVDPYLLAYSGRPNDMVRGILGSLSLGISDLVNLFSKSVSWLDPTTWFGGGNTGSSGSPLGDALNHFIAEMPVGFVVFVMDVELLSPLDDPNSPPTAP